MAFNNSSSSSSNNNSQNGVVFEDYFPAMVEKLGTEKFMEELCKGYEALADEEKGVITRESLKRKADALGVRDMSEEEIDMMMKEGDVDGDGCLNQMEFCVLMFRLSPGLMDGSLRWLHLALSNH